MIDDQDILLRFKAAVRIVDAQRRILIESKAELRAIEDLASIIRHLNGLSDAQVMRIMLGSRHIDRLTNRKKADQASQTAGLSLAVVQSIVDRDRTTRAELEAIAVGRFQVPKGSLRSIGNMEQLREKLQTFINNEKSHEAISNVAHKLKF